MPGGSRKRIQSAYDTMVVQSLCGDIARLNGLRRRLRCSQSQLAQMIGVSQSSLSRLFQLPQMPVDSSHFLATREGLSRIELALGMFPARRKPRNRQKDQNDRNDHDDHEDHKNHKSYTGQEVQPHAAPDSSPSPEERDADLSKLSKLSMIDASRPVHRLLIAEDDRETVELYTVLFTKEERRLRYDVTVATTTGECLQRLRAAEQGDAYDLLVMDLDLGDRPDASGTSLLDHLRRLPRWIPPHLLVVSGLSPHVLRSKLVDLARLDAAYLPKPFDIEELLDSVYTLVTGKRLAPKYHPQG